MSSLDFLSIRSSLQHISFFDEDIEGETYLCNNISTPKNIYLNNFNSAVCVFVIESRIENVGVISSFKACTYVFLEIDIVDSIYGLDTLPVYGPSSLINYRESVRFEFLSDYKMTQIEIPHSIRILGLRGIKKSRYDIISIRGSVRKKIESSVYSGILEDAIHAKNIFLTQLFKVRPKSEDKRIITRHLFSDCVDPYRRVSIIKESHFINYISLRYSIYRMSVIKEIDTTYVDILPGVYVSPYTTDLHDAVYHLKLFRQIVSGDSYSDTVHISVRRDDTACINISLTRQEFETSFDDFVSGVFEIVMIHVDSYDYSIVSLADFYSNEISPSVAIYTDGNMSKMSSAIYSFAKWNDHKDTTLMLFGIGRFSISSKLPANIGGIVCELCMVYAEYTSTSILDLAVFTSPGITIEIGVIADQENNVGLHKTIYFDDFSPATLSSTPWFSPGFSLIKIADWLFQDITMDGDTDNLRLLSESKASLILLDWKRTVIDSYTFMFNAFKTAPYYRIENKESRDFVLIIPSSSGGSVLHMQGDNHQADSYLGEAAAREISSPRYKRHAKVLYDTVNGLTYSAETVLNATEYLSKKSIYTDFFLTFNYNGYEIADIINNQNIDSVTNDFFSRVNIHTLGGVAFSYSEEMNIETDNVKSGVVLSHIFAKTSGSKYVINSTITPVKVGRKSTFVNILSNCGIGDSCRSVRISWNVEARISFETTYISMPKYFPIIMPPIDIETGTRDLINARYVMYYPGWFSNLSGYITAGSDFEATIGTYLERITYPGSIKVGLDSIDGVVYPGFNIFVGIDNSSFSDINSEFFFKIILGYDSSYLSRYYSTSANFTVNSGRMNLENYCDNVDAIWMKMFFPVSGGRNFAESKIMEFFITEESLSKDFDIVYKYIDTYADGDPSLSKGGTPDIRETKYKDVGGDGHRTSYSSYSSGVCGYYRNATYLSYQGFDHIFDFDSKDRLWGNYTAKTKEAINSPYLKIIKNKVTLPGVVLSDASVLSRSTNAAILARVNDLEEVYDWKIEEFTLDAEDLRSFTIDASELRNIDNAFRSTLKFVIASKGLEIQEVADLKEKTNLFPVYPDRVIDDKFFDFHTTQNYIITLEKDDV